MNISNATLWPNRKLITNIPQKVTPRTAIAKLDRDQKLSGIPNKLNFECFVQLEIFLKIIWIFEIFPILKKIQAAKKRLKIMEA